MLLKNDIITQKILIDNFIYAVTYQDGNFILHHDQLLSPASVDSKRLVFGYLDIRRFLTHNDRR